MTKETWDKHNKYKETEYVGKHRQKEYFVQIARGANMRPEGFFVTGMENVRSMIRNGNFYDWEVKDEYGFTINPKIILYGGN